MAKGPIPDKPANRPTVPELQRLVNAYYQFKNCGVGGDLHVVLDDANWDDCTIQACVDDAGTYGDREPECARVLGRLLLLTTRTQRRKIRSGYGGRPMVRDEFLAEASRLLERCVPR